MSYFKFSYFFNIGSAINANTFIKKIPEKMSKIITESVCEDPKDKFRNYFSMLGHDLSVEFVLALEPMM
jgi:hypothetical protein